MDWYILMKYKFDTTLTSWWWHTRNKPRNGITSSSPASCQLNFLIFWFSSSPLMGAEVNLLPCTDCSPGLIIPPVTALWLMDIGWSEIANWKIGVGHGDFYEFTLWVKLRYVFKHFFDHEPLKFTTKNILHVCQHNERFTLSLCLITGSDSLHDEDDLPGHCDDNVQCCCNKSTFPSGRKTFANWNWGFWVNFSEPP